ncbi:hypothetical protein TWF506_010960 [Arthrobotrys conoides]|uniref:Uncharacterized protein n=1 Tax=Arthrobotrys conoides TaxID=74498 RepID=A0AAN8N0C7_9PEZI
MAYPYNNNLGGRQDPNDPRYQVTSYYPGAALEGNYHLYPDQLDIESDGLEYQNGQYADPGDSYSYEPHYPPHIEFDSQPSSNPSTRFSGVWDTASRNISSRTAPEDDPPPVQAGQRCIFYWINCGFKASNHDDWAQHIYYDHFESEKRRGMPHRLDLGHTPTSWTCRFRGCQTVVKNDDHRALWDGKLAHIFGHFKNDYGRPEDIQEDLTWLKYYESMGLCNAFDVYGGHFHPPAQKPYTQGVMMWKKMPRKVKNLTRGLSHQDAPGEQIRSAPSERMPHGSYMPSSAQYQPPPEQAYESYPQNQPMAPGPYTPPQAPDQYHHQYHHHVHPAPY